MRKPMIPLVCVVLPLLWSCGPKHTELVKVVNWSADESSSWEGRTREELVADLGQPTSTKADGKGGEVYSYNEINVSGGPQPPILSPGVTEKPDTNLYPIPGGILQEFTTPVVVETKALAKFWIDKDGVVYEQWIEPGLKIKKRTEFEKLQRVP